jgi:heptosyltransferase I
MSDRSLQTATAFHDVLIVMMSALGDAVHVLPVINALKRARPDSRISWVLQPGPASLIAGHPAVDEFLIFEKSRGLRALTVLRSRMSGRRWDLLLALQVYFKASLVTALANADVKLGFDRARARDLNWLFTNQRIPPRPVQHVQDQYLEFLDPLGVEPEPLEWNLGPWPEERPAQSAFFAGLDRPAAILVIATSNRQKDWVPERWAVVCDSLHADFGLQPVLAGGRSPRELEVERIIRQHSSAPLLSTLGFPLRDLVWLLDGSALVISPDTGPLHMAVALNRPVISLMAFNDPLRIGPYRRFHDLLIDAYHDPGEVIPPTPGHRRGRMPRISAAAVLEKVQIWRDRYRR